MSASSREQTFYSYLKLPEDIATQVVGFLPPSDLPKLAAMPGGIPPSFELAKRYESHAKHQGMFLYHQQSLFRLTKERDQQLQRYVEAKKSLFTRNIKVRHYLKIKRDFFRSEKILDCFKREISRKDYYPRLLKQSKDCQKAVKEYEEGLERYVLRQAKLYRDLSFLNDNTTKNEVKDGQPNDPDLKNLNSFELPELDICARIMLVEGMCLLGKKNKLTLDIIDMLDAQFKTLPGSWWSDSTYHFKFQLMRSKYLYEALKRQVTQLHSKEEEKRITQHTPVPLDNLLDRLNRLERETLESSETVKKILKKDFEQNKYLSQYEYIASHPNVKERMEVLGDRSESLHQWQKNAKKPLPHAKPPVLVLLVSMAMIFVGLACCLPLAVIGAAFFVAGGATLFRTEETRRRQEANAFKEATDILTSEDAKILSNIQKLKDNVLQLQRKKALTSTPRVIRCSHGCSHVNYHPHLSPPIIPKKAAIKPPVPSQKFTPSPRAVAASSVDSRIFSATPRLPVPGDSKRDPSAGSQTFPPPS